MRAADLVALGIATCNGSKMPIYLVRWPTLSASLVRARNQEELLDILDEVADPGACTFKVYQGPIWVDFDLPFEITDVDGDQVTSAADLRVEPEPGFTGEIDAESLLRLGTPVCDAVTDMRLEVLRGAFPTLARLLDERTSTGERAPEDLDRELRAALVAELSPLVEHLREAAAIEARDDFEATMMKQLGVTRVTPAMERALREVLQAAPAQKAD